MVSNRRKLCRNRNKLQCFWRCQLKLSVLWETVEHTKMFYGDRNCYTLNPEKSKDNHNNSNNKYLIRALFSYGNYDGKNQTPSFDLYLGVNLWDTFDKTGVYKYQIAETIHTQSSPSDTIQVCLVKTSTIPCISSLELRPLDNSLYPIMSPTSTSRPQPLLRLMLRIDAGSPTQPVHSLYKDDVYDRIWRYDKDLYGWNLYNTTKLNDSTIIDPGTTSNVYRLPPQVFSTAIQSPNVISYIYEFPAPEDSFEYYLYFHFAEIEQLPVGSKRVINITLNSKNVLSEPLFLEYLEPVTINPNFSVKGYINFIISATPESDAPPILNAFEMYKLIELNSTTDTRDVGAIVDIKGAYKISRLSWQGDPCLPMQYVWDGLNCSSNTIPRITSLNLRSSNLKGVINSSFSYLTELRFLDLSDNELEGALPEFLAELPKLKALNLTGNKFSGEIPKALKVKAETERTLQLSVDNNPDLCTTDSCNNKKNFIVPIVASLSALIVIFMISLGGFWILKRRHQKVEARTNNSTKGRANNSIKGGNSLESKNRAFSYTEILNMTDNLRTIIGEGGFGKVYLGILQDHVQVAVKLLSSSSVQGFREFRSETQLLSVVHHRNLVSLIGYCEEGDTKALIYEYMPNGNLHQHLSDKNPDALKWNERLNIAVDIASGLDYLHNGCKPPIVHRDLKASNILLDQWKHAKIADFGLSRAFCNDFDTHVSTRPAGTPGYIDPEFHRTGILNKKSDVYSFGIILVELITAQRAIARSIANNGENIHILKWVKPKVERGYIKGIVDPRLHGEFDANSAWKFVEIALSCTSPNPIERPDISQIFVELKECLSLNMVGISTEISSPLATEFAPLAR